MSVIGQGISLRGMVHNDFHYPFYLAAAVVRADVDKAVAIDATGPNKVKLAGDGDQILGKLATLEDRSIEGVKVGTVELRGGWRFKIATGETVTVGQTVVGAGGGEVTAAAAYNAAANTVVEVANGYAIVIR